MNRSQGYSVKAYPVRRQGAVTKIDYQRAKLLYKLLLLGVFMVVLALFYIWSRVQIVQLSYQINHLKNERTELVNLNKQLKVELSLLKSPKRIEMLSRKDLKMSLPDERRILTLK